MLLVKRDSIFEDGLHPVFFQACGIAVLFNLFQGLRASFLQHVAFCVFDFNDNPFVERLLLSYPGTIRGSVK